MMLKIQIDKRERKNIIKFYLKYNDNEIIVWGFYRFCLEFQTLNGYYICILWNFTNQEATFTFNFNPNSYKKVYSTINYYKEWYFGFSFICWDVFFFTIINISWFQGWAYPGCRCWRRYWEQH